MNKLSIVIAFLLCMNSVSGAPYENTAVGMAFEYPDTWKQVPVLEVNKPYSIFEAIRKENDKQFLALVVFPTQDLAVNRSGLENWTNGNVDAFNVEKKDVTSPGIQNLANGNWYSVVLNSKNNKVILYSTVINGYSYSLSFSTNDTKDKSFDSDALQIISSARFSTPASFKTVEEDFDNAFKDDASGLLIPRGFRMTNLLNRKETAPYAYSLYQGLLLQNNADYVLVANDMQEQLFALNVKLNNKIFDTVTLHLLSKFVGNKFTQEGTSYEEVTIAPWDMSPGNVFLHKFRLVKTDVATTHYIFYCTRNNKMDIIKIQTSTALEGVFEKYFFALIMKEL